MSDLRYEQVTCSACGRTWQFIDLGCALHRLTCAAVDRDDVRTAVVRDWAETERRARVRDAQDGVLAGPVGVRS
jgi:hypothetical protein